MPTTSASGLKAAMDGSMDGSIMDIEDHPDFPRFNIVSSGLRDAEERLLQALKRGDKTAIVAAKLDLMGALDEYSKFAVGIGNDLA